MKKLGKPARAGEYQCKTATVDVAGTALPSRLHHTAWVVEDQARTRAFYEGALGFKLTAFWIEKGKDPAMDHVMTFSHAFYSLEDGSALAFFCHDHPEDKVRFRSPVIEVFNHVAVNVTRDVQNVMLERLKVAGIDHRYIDHGYCKSLYVVDPDGFRLEFTLDTADVERINEQQLVEADGWYDKWIGGHREANNHLFVGHGRDHAVLD